MARPIVRIHDMATQEITDREMNDAEFAQLQSDLATFEAKAEKVATKEAAKVSALAKLGALGLTEDEVNGLIS
jgi:hypothetical protein